MTAPAATGFPITDFASLTRFEDDAAGEFRIVLSGPLRYVHLIGVTVGELHVLRAEYEEYVGPLDDPDPAARYPLDEFVDYQAIEDMATGTFRIAMKGPIRFSALISYKLSALRVQQTEIDEYGEM